MLTIGKLADYVGVTPRAIRLYHQRGLLPEPARTPGGYRVYTAADINRDDRNILEFAYARTVGRGGSFGDVEVALAARAMSATSPPVRGAFDAARVRQARVAMLHEGRLVVCAPPEEFIASPHPVVRDFLQAQGIADLRDVRKAFGK